MGIQDWLAQRKITKTMIGCLLLSLLSAVGILDLLIHKGAVAWLTLEQYSTIGVTIAGLTGAAMQLGIGKIGPGNMTSAQKRALIGGFALSLLGAAGTADTMVHAGVTTWLTPEVYASIGTAIAGFTGAHMRVGVRDAQAQTDAQVHILSTTVQALQQTPVAEVRTMNGGK